MSRIRNEARWKIPFKHHKNAKEFFSEARTDGIHSVKLGQQNVDILIQDRRHQTTLVVFSGRLSLAAQFTPQFSGLRIAEDTGVNLVSVADPSMAMGDITVAWYMGNHETGPLRPFLSPIINHALESLKTQRTILFGGSGGGFAAANYAHDFPDSLVFIFNPRLTLRRHAKSPVSTYLRESHNVVSDGNVTEHEETVLSPYGPTEAFHLAECGLNHDLLIYQNLLDPDFLGTQVMPYIRKIGEDPRLRVKFSVDNLGHSAIPPETVRALLGHLANEKTVSGAIAAADFCDPKTAMIEAFNHTPEIVTRLRKITQQSKTDTERLKSMGNRVRHAEAEARTSKSKLFTVEQNAEDRAIKLQSEVTLLERELRPFQQIKQYIPKPIKVVASKLLSKLPR